MPNVRELCGPGGPLTAAERRELPDRDFGVPFQRRFPMPDVTHARSAKARAAQAFDRGRLTREQLLDVNRKAGLIIQACKAGTGTDDELEPGWPWWAYGGVGVGVLGVVSGILWAIFKKPDEAPPRVEPAEPQTKGEHPLPDPPILEPDPKQEAEGAAAEPPGPPEAEPEEEPEEEPSGATLQWSQAQPGIAAHGETRSLIVSDLGAWVQYAGELVEGVNIEGAWPAVQVVDKLWSQVFPVLGDNASAAVPPWEVQGKTLASTIATAQTFIDHRKAGGMLPEDQDPAHMFAQIMVGGTFKPINVSPALDLPPNAALYIRNGHPILLVPRMVDNPALGASQLAWFWYAWPPGTETLSPGTASKEGAEGKQPEALVEATTAVN